MDLRETPQHTLTHRHPWELARAKALRAIAETRGLLLAGTKVLDLGCGDGFLIDTLCPGSSTVIDAVDIHLSDDQLAAFCKERPRLKFHNSDLGLAEHSYGLVTMFDVLEHVEDEVGFLRETKARFAAPGAHFFCTAPAFQSLFSSHDIFLKHYRRYTRHDFEQVLSHAGLRVVSSGYLFGLLLPVRGLAVLAEKLLGAAETQPGVGHWRYGRYVTSTIQALLEADNYLLLCLARIGVKIPGLTVWAVCETLR